MKQDEHGRWIKDAPGTRQRSKHDRRIITKRHEQSEMRAAQNRDHGKCRWPGCDGHNVGLRMDAAHMRDSHRGMGGNLAGDKTTRAKVITLCIEHHRKYDHFDIAIEPLTDKQFDGPCAFYRTEGPTVHVASEKLIGVSV